MKKILISILVVLLAILTYFVIWGNINIGDWKNKNINDIKNLKTELSGKISVIEQINYQEYKNAKTELEKAIEDLKIAKDKYETKTSNISDDVELGVVEIKEYKIERLWIALENYAKDENVTLQMDLLDTEVEGVYDLDVTVVGEYMAITDFIYDIEKDDTLGFKILNFKLVPNTQIVSTVTQENGETTNNAPTASVSVDKLKATFKIEDVGIELN